MHIPADGVEHLQRVAHARLRCFNLLGETFAMLEPIGALDLDGSAGIEVGLREQRMLFDTSREGVQLRERGLAFVRGAHVVDVRDFASSCRTCDSLAAAAHSVLHVRVERRARFERALDLVQLGTSLLMCSKGIGEPCGGLRSSLSPLTHQLKRVVVWCRRSDMGLELGDQVVDARGARALDARVRATRAAQIILEPIHLVGGLIKRFKRLADARIHLLVARVNVVVLGVQAWLLSLFGSLHRELALLPSPPRSFLAVGDSTLALPSRVLATACARSISGIRPAGALAIQWHRRDAHAEVIHRLQRQCAEIRGHAGVVELLARCAPRLRRARGARAVREVTHVPTLPGCAARAVGSARGVWGVANMAAPRGCLAHAVASAAATVSAAAGLSGAGLLRGPSVTPAVVAERAGDLSELGSHVSDGSRGGLWVRVALPPAPHARQLRAPHCHDAAARGVAARPTTRRREVQRVAHARGDEHHVVALVVQKHVLQVGDSDHCARGTSEPSLVAEVPPREHIQLARAQQSPGD
mmetsp:Transcript_7681/g.31197  ORF Transcript_7681/g.31197 Transcript_7681/m.31197 type:complete len:528 (-) Transcript_7681:98-1681(-)